MKNNTKNIILCIGDFESGFHWQSVSSIIHIFKVVFRKYKLEEGVNSGNKFNAILAANWKDAKYENSTIYKSVQEIVYPFFLSDKEHNIDTKILDMFYRYNIIGVISYSFTYQANKLLEILGYFDVPILIALATNIEYCEPLKIKYSGHTNILRLVPGNESQAEVLKAAIETNALSSKKKNLRINILSKPQNNIYVNDLKKLIYDLFEDTLIIEHYNDEDKLLINNPHAVLVVSYPSEFDFKKYYNQIKDTVSKPIWYFTDSYYAELEEVNYQIRENNSSKNESEEKGNTVKIISAPRIWMSSPEANIGIIVADAYLSLCETWKIFQSTSINLNDSNFMTLLIKLLQADLRFASRYFFRANINVMGGFRLKLMKLRK